MNYSSLVAVILGIISVLITLKYVKQFEGFDKKLAKISLKKNNRDLPNSIFNLQDKLDLTDSEFNLLIKNREKKILDALIPVDKDCNNKFPYRTRIKDHAKVNFKYCFKDLDCAKGKKKCNNKKWKVLPLVDEGCSKEFPFRTRIPEHKKDNYKYCFKELDCATGNKACDRDSWRIMSNKVDVNKTNYDENNTAYKNWMLKKIDNNLILKNKKRFKKNKIIKRIKRERKMRNNERKKFIKDIVNVVNKEQNKREGSEITTNDMNIQKNIIQNNNHGASAIGAVMQNSGAAMQNSGAAMQNSGAVMQNFGAVMQNSGAMQKKSSQNTPNITSKGGHKCISACMKLEEKPRNPKHANETHYCKVKKYLLDGKYYDWDYVDSKKCNNPIINKSELKTLQNAANILKKIPPNEGFINYLNHKQRNLNNSKLSNIIKHNKIKNNKMYSYADLEKNAKENSIKFGYHENNVNLYKQYYPKDNSKNGLQFNFPEKNWCAINHNHKKYCFMVNDKNKELCKNGYLTNDISHCHYY